MEPIFGSKLVLFMYSSHNFKTDRIPFVWGCGLRKRQAWECCHAWSARWKVWVPQNPSSFLSQKGHLKSSQGVDSFLTMVVVPALPFHCHQPDRASDCFFPGLTCFTPGPSLCITEILLKMLLTHWSVKNRYSSVWKILIHISIQCHHSTSV